MKSPWAWIKNLFARNGQDPQQIIRYVLPYPVAGVNLTADEALCLSVVWACIDAIARGIGQCDWNVYMPISKGRRDLVENDPLMWLLNTRPNPDITAIGFREAMLFQAIPFGNAYAEIVPDRAGRVAALEPLPNDRVMPRRDPETWKLFYEYRTPAGEVVRLEQRQVFHLRGPGLYGLLGDNIVARAAKSMAVAAAQERYSAAFFGQGATPGGLLTFDKTLTPEQKKTLKEDFAEKRKGPENAHKPLILESGMKWEATSVDPDKSQLIEGKQFSVEDICRWFGVPPHKVQHLLRATFSNIEHQSIEFVTDAVNPWCRRLEQEADVKLIRQDRAPWRYTKFDTRPLLSGDAKSRADAYAILRQNGIATANECRAWEGMNDAGPDGDVLLVQSNLTTVQQILKPPKPPAPALPPGRVPPTDDEDTLDPHVPPDPDDEAAAVARQALTVIVAGALDRYAKRLEKRRADLARKHAGAELEQLLAAERTTFLPRLFEDLAPAQPFAVRVLGRQLEQGDLSTAAQLVDAGEHPELALAKALPAACPRAA